MYRTKYLCVCVCVYIYIYIYYLISYGLQIATERETHEQLHVNGIIFTLYTFDYVSSSVSPSINMHQLHYLKYVTASYSTNNTSLFLLKQLDYSLSIS